MSAAAFNQFQSVVLDGVSEENPASHRCVRAFLDNYEYSLTVGQDSERGSFLKVSCNVESNH